ncbi:MAG: RNA polymerase sigma factor [Armatimonadetes bacterium]|nr:RNA polymerase sigma factor [Armatimonadota bacterium]
MPDLELKALVERARGGDDAAFEQLYERFERAVYGLCRRLLTSDDAAEDAAQQVWLAIWQGLSSLRQPEAFTSWLKQTATRVCGRTQRRRRWWSWWSEVEGDDAPDLDPADQAPMTVDSLARGEQDEAVRAALERLSPEHREVVVLHHLEGLGVGEIAVTLGVATGTVKSRLGRARAHLARILGPLAE